MKITAHNFSARRLAAVTLLELLVSVSLLMVIVLGLYQMFNRTQSVLRNSMASVNSVIPLSFLHTRFTFKPAIACCNYYSGDVVHCHGIGVGHRRGPYVWPVCTASDTADRSFRTHHGAGCG